MTLPERELLVARILAGYTRITVNDDVVLLYPASIHAQYQAHELYSEIYNLSMLHGMMSEDEVFGMLVQKKIWDEAKETELETLTKDIENMKVGLYELIFKSRDLQLARKYLTKAQARYEELHTIRHAYDYVTCEGLAALIRSRYVIAAGLRKWDGSKYWENEYSDAGDGVLDVVMEKYYRGAISEKQYREVARTDPWRMTWGLKKSGMPVISKPIAEFSTEQRILFFWSTIYDNIHESPDCPPETVMNDDDTLDGWLIMQRRKREDAIEKHRLESTIKVNQKIRDAQEIYIPAQSMEDAMRVNKLNDDMGRIIKAKRWAAMKAAGGSLSVLEMPDIKQELHMQINRKFADTMRGG